MIILFDLDGTLIDSTEAILESFGMAYEMHGDEVPDPKDPTKKGGATKHTDPGKYFPWTAFMQSIGSDIARVCRITSYNVCYTKLLRICSILTLRSLMQ